MWRMVPEVRSAVAVAVAVAVSVSVAVPPPRTVGETPGSPDPTTRGPLAMSLNDHGPGRAAQVMQVAAAGRAASRAGPIGAPQRSQVP